MHEKGRGRPHLVLVLTHEAPLDAHLQAGKFSGEKKHEPLGTLTQLLEQQLQLHQHQGSKHRPCLEAKDSHGHQEDHEGKETDFAHENAGHIPGGEALTPCTKAFCERKHTKHTTRMPIGRKGCPLTTPFYGV